MPSHKLTWEFTAAVLLPGSALQPADATTGWTESWYVAADESDQVALARILPGALFFNTRRRLLTQGWRIARARAIRFPGSRTGARAGIAPADGQGQYLGPPTAGLPGDESAYDRLVVTIASNAGKIRSWMMGGIGPDVISGSGQYAAPGNFAANFTSLQTVLVGNYALRITTPGPVRPIFNLLNSGITTVGLNPPTIASPYVLITPASPEMVVGAQVRISGPQGVAGANGIWTINGVVGAGPLTVQLAAKRGTVVLGTYTQGGTIKVLTPSLDSIASLFPEFGSSRKSGGPPSRRRGRRKIRR